jgi:UDP-glucose 4-epimerase
MEDRIALVTGAAGFIGSHLCDRLLADGWTVRGVDSFEDYYPREYKERNVAAALSNDRFSLLEGNLLDLDKPASAVRLLVPGVDAVFHLAAQAGVRASWGTSFSIYTNNNVLGTQLLLEACKAERTDKAVYASSSSVYGDTDILPMVETARCLPYLPYGVSKLAAENLCYLYWRNFGLPTVALRFFTVYGPRQRPDMGFHRFVRCLLEDRAMPLYGDGAVLDTDPRCAAVLHCRAPALAVGAHRTCPAGRTGSRGPRVAGGCVAGLSARCTHPVLRRQDT